MKKWYVIVLALFSCHTKQRTQKIELSSDTVVVLNSGKAKVVFTLLGSSIVDFQLHEFPLNPFTWKLTREQMPSNNRQFVFQGHFLCSGRWGSPSPEEIAVGIPHNGEVNTEKWEISQPLTLVDGVMKVSTFCFSPTEKLDVMRTVEMAEQSSFFYVTETFTNRLPIGRPFNVVQHGTVAAPFLSSSTLIDTNAEWGFNQKDSTHQIEKNPFKFPHGIDLGRKVNLRTTTDTASFVTTHIFPKETSVAWLTATSPENCLVLGYVWNPAEYPFVNIWNQKDDEKKPVALGLEFGTTGKGIQYKELLKNGGGKFMGIYSFDYIEPNEAKTYHYGCFLAKAPKNFLGVGKLEIDGQKIILYEYGKGERSIVVDMGKDFLK
ncbi:MAG: hypothetical protein NZM38_04630 [Cytophagales bacterium]|nr:hypothetical protein [Cytophagales bacterium]MDW8384039.1 hypothetical protein [Flammeovirgaceae bacterium]